MNGSLFFECTGTTTQCWTSDHRVFLVRRHRILEKSTEVLGSRDIAQRWLISPAIGLGHLAPCSLLGKYESYTEVSDFLCRLEYGVYT